MSFLHEMISKYISQICITFFAGEVFNISVNETIWGQACKLASSKLTYLSSKESFKMSLTDLKLPEKGLWIGFVEAFAAYTYAGNSIPSVLT